MHVCVFAYLWGAGAFSFEVSHPAVWVGCVPLDMPGYPDLQTFRLMGHQREEERKERETAVDQWGEIESKLGGNWDGQQSYKDKEWEVQGRGVCVSDGESV